MTEEEKIELLGRTGFRRCLSAKTLWERPEKMGARITVRVRTFEQAVEQAAKEERDISGDIPLPGE